MVIALPELIFGLCMIAAPIVTPLLVHQAVQSGRRRLADFGAVLAAVGVVDTAISPSWWLLGFAALTVGAVAVGLSLPGTPERARRWARATIAAGTGLVLAAVIGWTLLMFGLSREPS